MDTAIRRFFMLATGVWLAAGLASGAMAGPALQANGGQAAGGDNGKCNAVPGQGKEGGDKPASKGAAEGAGRSLTNKLSDCGGVLKPPDVGDQGVVKPAPHTGQMPVIKPGQIRPQPPKKGGNGG